MTRPYEGLDGGKPHSYREHFRTRWPNASRCVVEDLDVVLRLYEPDDPRGRFLLLEFKYGRDLGATGGQHHTFKLMHRLMTQGDPTGEFYRGLYLVNYIETDDGEFVPLKLSAWPSKTILSDPTLDDFDEYLRRKLQPTDATSATNWLLELKLLSPT